MSAVPTVSVLVKSYNHARYARQTIESVLSQSFQDFEIVVTDDASTDGTAQVVRGFADPRIRLDVFRENQGISAAMNATIGRARGRYLAILNSDDWALPERLARQVAFLDANPLVSAVFGLPLMVNEQGAPLPPYDGFLAPLRDQDFSHRWWLRQFFLGGNCLCAPTAMIRREVYATTGLYDVRLTNLQDLDMWVRMLLAGHALHMLDQQVTAFRVRDNHANMSAPRPDSNLRHAFETTKILGHYASFDPALFEEVFGKDAADTVGVPVGLRLAVLALRDPRAAYQNFGLNLFYASARTAAEFRRLRALTGSIDALGIGGINSRNRLLVEMSNASGIPLPGTLPAS
jgi:glycosyltransferase involved in cell wall biosynthesis